MNLRQQYLQNLSSIKTRVYKVPSGTHHYLYQITNNLNGKIYIGRRSSHVPDHEDDYMGSGTHLWYAINKHGIQNFTKTVLHICPTFEELCALEQTIVNQEFVDRPDTYNQTTGGLSLGSPSRLIRLNNGLVRRKTQLSIEHKDKISKSLKGRELSYLTRLKISESKTGGRLGIPLSLSHKMSISLGRKGKKHSLESRLKISESKKGSKMSPSVKRNLSLLNTGRQHTAEAREKISERLLLDQNRPWKNRNMDLSRIHSWSKLDSIFNIYVLYSFKNWSVLFERDVISSLGIKPTGYMVDYFRRYGNPEEDPEWVLFKSRYDENLFPNKLFQNS